MLYSNPDDIPASDEMFFRVPAGYSCILLLLTIISIVLLAGYLVLKYNSRQSETAEEQIPMSSLVSPGRAVKTAGPYATAAPITEGYIAPADLEKEYELGETLSIAKMINEKISDYLDKAIREIRQYQEDPEYDYVQALPENRARISRDLETLKDYESVFAVYGGYSYVRAAEDRLVNAATLYNDLDNEMDDEELIRMVNRYIENENVLTENAKAALIEYLNENDVDYELETATIKDDSMQFEKETEDQIQEGTETGETDKEESIYK